VLKSIIYVQHNEILFSQKDEQKWYMIMWSPNITNTIKL
jgi:hypothetical protein